MKKLIVNLLALIIIGFGVTKVIQLQYSNGYYKVAYKNGIVTLAERDRQLNCLAQNVYYESANESAEGKMAVAQVTMNRAESGKFPNDICRVVYQTSQFSWVKDKPKALNHLRDKGTYNESMEIAKRVLLEGFRLHSIDKALYYHASSVNPTWNKRMTKLNQIGNHIFYGE